MRGKVFRSPWPVGKTLPDERYQELIERFEGFGGQSGFLSWLAINFVRRGVGRSSLADLVVARDGLHAARIALESKAVRAALPEAASLEMGMLWVETRLALLADHEHRREQSRSRKLKARATKPGRALTRQDLYSWLGALVPYTAMVSGKPRWSWIDDWLRYRELAVPDDGGTQKYWDKMIASRLRKGLPISRELADLLLRAAEEFFLYRTIMTEAGEEGRDHARDDERFKLAVAKFLPFARKA